MGNNLLFALDIGTRSVVGLIGRQTDTAIEILTVERQEHNTRAMLDGQIHDVPEVAKVIGAVKARLEASVGPLRKVSVAAAGRALFTIHTKAELETAGRTMLSAEDERTLELSAIQNAQKQLATTDTLADPGSYYCVGYSVVGFSLDGVALKNLVGQYGKLASIQLIATFLPRQVIDSLQSAISAVGLEMSTLTLEPIAAISVLIPPSMRHLNLTLVDVGAGTSDVAITRDGSVIGYGMVPCAGDEITEALSRKFLLDFNVAETVKRDLNGKARKHRFIDVLGLTHKISTQEIIDSIRIDVQDLAQAIADQILTLNTVSPQAVLLVGGGSLTPLLPQALAEALAIPAARVAVRQPDNIIGMSAIPLELRTPDAVTPLGILKLAGGRSLTFVNVTVNTQLLRLFNLGKLTVADALLTAGIDIRTLHGRPGLGITVSVNGQTKFIPGSNPTPGVIKRNGIIAKFSDFLEDQDVVTVDKGADGKPPRPILKTLVIIPEPYTVRLNGKPYNVLPHITVNGVPVAAETELLDRDQVLLHLPTTLEEVLSAIGHVSTLVHYTFTVNGQPRRYSIAPQLAINNLPAMPATALRNNDVIAITPPPHPSIGKLLGIEEDIRLSEAMTILLNGAKFFVPTRRHTVLLNKQPAKLTDPASNNATIEYFCQEQSNPTISDVLLAAEFNPRVLPIGAQVAIVLNQQPTEYTAHVQTGDSIDIVITTPCSE